MRPPTKQGLYDPQHEHDACGVGFLVDIAGTQVGQAGPATRSRCCATSATAAPAAARRTPATAPASCCRCPTPSCARSPAGLGITLPPAGEYAAGVVFLPDRRRGRAPPARSAARAGGRPRPGSRSWAGATVPTDNSRLGATRGALAARHPPGVRGPRARASPDDGGLRARASTSPGAMAENLVRAAGDLPDDRQGPVLRLQPVLEDHGLQGHADRRPAGRSSSPT